MISIVHYALSFLASCIALPGRLPGEGDMLQTLCNAIFEQVLLKSRVPVPTDACVYSRSSSLLPARQALPGRGYQPAFFSQLTAGRPPGTRFRITKNMFSRRPPWEKIPESSRGQVGHSRCQRILTALPDFRLARLNHSFPDMVATA